MIGILLPGDFVVESLELHLFFGRIMKEHSLFLKAGFVAKDDVMIKQAGFFQARFSEVLMEAVCLSNGIVTEEILQSGESVTNKTLRAEQITEELSGIPIESVITNEELNLFPNVGNDPAKLEQKVIALNQKAIALARELVQFKTNVLEAVLHCQLYTYNFPLLIIHIRREALLYIQQLERLQRHIAIDFMQEALEEERFWNRQMAEHAQFIRQLLDPTEAGLIEKAEAFDRQFNRLEQKVPPGAVSAKSDIRGLTNETIGATKALRDFKAAGTEGILVCKIKSIIVPLLADHVLREANHYLRVLNRAKRDLQL